MLGTEKGALGLLGGAEKRTPGWEAGPGPLGVAGPGRARSRARARTREAIKYPLRGYAGY